MGTRNQFTPEFKREAVQLVESGSRPASAMVRELGVRRNQLYSCEEEQAQKGQPRAESSAAKSRPEMSERHTLCVGHFPNRQVDSIRSS